MPASLIVDTHVHLNSPEYLDDLDAVLERSRAAGVSRWLIPGYDRPSSQRAVEMAARIEGASAAVGVHPHDARFYDDETEATFDAWLAQGAAVAAGEMGLDYHYDHSPRDVQRRVLQRQLRLARRHRVPVCLHNRESDEDAAALLRDEASGMRLVLHAFNAAPLLQRLGCDLGFYFGIGGFLTFRKHPLAACIRELPRQFLLLETDSPWLSPHPFRGKRNEPARVAIIAERLAALLEMSVEEVAALSSANYQRFLEGESGS
jgi:TatD DNase family protein